MDLRAVDIGGGSAPKIEAGNGITKSGTGTAGDPMILSVSDPLEGTFVPRHDTAENLATVLLEDGEIATTTDTGEIRVGDGVTPGGLGYIDPDKFQKVIGQGGYTTHTSGSAANRRYKTVYGDGVFVKAYYTGAATFHYSHDGEKWTFIAAPYNMFTDVAYGNGVFVAVGIALSGIGISNDGVKWRASTLTTRSTFIVFGPGFFVFRNAPAASLSLSYDGENVFRTIDLSGYATLLNASGTQLSYLGERFVLFTTTTTVTYLLTSTDAITWTQVNYATIGAITDICDVAYGHGLFILTNSAGTAHFYTADFVTFTAFTPEIPFAIAYFFEGNFYAISTTTGQLLLSKTGISGWKTVNSDNLFPEYTSNPSVNLGSLGPRFFGGDGILGVHSLQGGSQYVFGAKRRVLKQYGYDSGVQAFSHTLHTTGEGGVLYKTFSKTITILDVESISAGLAIPAGAKLDNIQLRVDSPLASTDLWDANWNNGANIQAICTAQAVAQNTKINAFFNVTAQSPVTTAVTDLVITKNGGGTFTAQGSIKVVGGYFVFETMPNFA